MIRSASLNSISTSILAQICSSSLEIVLDDSIGMLNGFGTLSLRTEISIAIFYLNVNLPWFTAITTALVYILML